MQLSDRTSRENLVVEGQAIGQYVEFLHRLASMFVITAVEYS
ncbi:hypothetical protein ACC786_14170 [Rhizobium ruizarguesonis]|nr:hypothetical protein [Rhizobium ruizarguesonis]